MGIKNPPQNEDASGGTERQGGEVGEVGEAASGGTDSRANPNHDNVRDRGSDHTDGQTRRSDAETIDVVTPRGYGATAAIVGPNSTQNKFDIAIRYHEELCAIVSDTVSAYCPWFVMHWFFYGATCLIGVIYISEEYTYSKNPFKLAYVSVFLVTHIYLFLFPCCCAAYITDTCGGTYGQTSQSL